MLICSNCGAELEDSTKICPACGHENTMKEGMPKGIITIVLLSAILFIIFLIVDMKVL